MRRVVHVEPDVRMLLAGSDEAAHTIGEHLRSAAGQRAEARVLELAQDLLVRETRERGHVVDLGGRVALEVHVGKRFVQRSDGASIELEVDVRVLAVDHVDLGEAGGLALVENVRDELVCRDRVGLSLLLGRRESAELALHPTDVRLVQIQVLDEVDLVGSSAVASRQVGELTESEQVVRLEEGEPVLEPESLARLDLLADRLQGAELRTTASLLFTAPGR